MVIIKIPNRTNFADTPDTGSENYRSLFVRLSALAVVLLMSGMISVAVLFLTAVAPVSAVDISNMSEVFSDSFDDLDNWKNPQLSWIAGTSPSGWGTDYVAYIDLNNPGVIGKNKPQNLITNSAKPIDLTDYQTVILQFDSSAKSTKRGNQKENVIVTDEHGVPHIVWAKSKATFTGLQQVDISNYVARNKSINLTFQYVKKGPAKDSRWEVDDLKVLGCTTSTKPYRTIQFNKSAYAVNEEDGTFAVLNLTCTPACTGTATVNWTASDGTAQAGINFGTEGDYSDVDVTGMVTFNAGDTYKLIQVPILDDHEYSSPDLTFNVSIEDVTDASGNTISGSPSTAEVTILDSNSDQAPVVTIVSSLSDINEGSSWSGSGSFTESGAGTSWDATVNYGDGSGVQVLTLTDKTFVLDHTYLDDGDYTVTVTVTNNNAIAGSEYAAVKVNNVAPTLVISGDASVDEDATYTLSLCSSDPGDDTIASWSIDWDDGNVETVTGDPASVTHVYADGPNDYVISATASDEDGTYATGNTVDVHVNVVIVTYTIPLKQGWNLVSYPVVNTTLKASDLAGTGVMIVASYNIGTGDYDAYNTFSSPPEYDISMSTDVGYFIYCTTDTSIVVYGRNPSDRSVTINPGWNLVGWSSFTSSTAKAVCNQPSLSGMQIIAKYNAITGDYDAYAEGSSPDEFDFNMHDGEGYFIYTMSSTPQALYFEAI